MRKTVQYTILFLLLFLITFVLLELGARGFMLVSDKARFLGHDFVSEVLYEDIDDLESLLDATCFGYAPFTENYGFVLNSRGFRSNEYQREKPEGVYRVVFLGDSFTINSGPLPYEHHWLRHLKAWAQERYGGAVEIINLGIPCTGPEFQKRLWEIEGSALQPDLVVHAFCTVNDYQDDFALKTQRGRDVGLEIGTERTFFSAVWHKLYRTSAFVRMAHNMLKLRGVEAGSDDLPALPQSKTYTSGGFEVETAPYNASRPSYTEDMYLTVNKEFLGWLHKDARTYFDRQAADVHRTLKAMYDSIERSGAELFVVIIPAEFQVDPKLFDEVAAAMGLPVDEFDKELAQTTLRAMLEEEGIAYIDLLDPFRESYNGRDSLYLLRDSHWNPAGNAVAAEAVEPVLERFIASEVTASNEQ